MHAYMLCSYLHLFCKINIRIISNMNLRSLVLNIQLQSYVYCKTTINILYAINSTTSTLYAVRVKFALKHCSHATHANFHVIKLLIFIKIRKYFFNNLITTLHIIFSVWKRKYAFEIFRNTKLNAKYTLIAVYILQLVIFQLQ